MNDGFEWIYYDLIGFCYNDVTNVVQYSLGHCSLEVELKRPEMATAKGWSGKIHRKKRVQMDSRCKWVILKVASVLNIFEGQFCSC